MIKWIIGAVVGVILVVCAFMVIDPRVNVGYVPNQDSTSEVLQTKISVVINGAIVNPGTYSIESTATLGDLIEKAGGLLTSADKTCFEESTSLEGRSKIYISFVSGYSEECVYNNAFQKVNVNTASVEELASVDGISTTIAQAIVNYRSTNGDFATLEDITNVSGIGEKTYEKIRDYICLK